jgi:hypothetical protein
MNVRESDENIMTGCVYATIKGNTFEKLNDTFLGLGP